MTKRILNNNEKIYISNEMNIISSSLMEIDDIDSLRKWWSNSLEHIINVQNRVSMTDTESSNEFVIISKKNDEETSMTKTETKIASSVKPIKGTNIKTCPACHIYVEMNNHECRKVCYNCFDGGASS